ncbi:MAG: exonuclease domain-containing protein [Patescibacteria group bacterium]|nr:exonuclease domain-containing protein [Patescibacteria group bacterium]
MKKIVFLDTETTGNEKKDFLCQLAYKTEGKTFCELYKPLIPIPPEASAITHITNKTVNDKPPFKDSKDYTEIKELLEDENTIMVAHNAKFDVGMVEKEGINPKNVICTLRVARYLDKENKIPQYRLQYLRYYLEIDIDAPAHDALGDVLVLEKLYERLSKKIDIDEMIEVSSKPSIMYMFTFGKYKGKTIEEVSKMDRGYLKWMLSQKEQNPDNEEDWIYTLKHYLGKLI